MESIRRTNHFPSALCLFSIRGQFNSMIGCPSSLGCEAYAKRLEEGKWKYDRPIEHCMLSNREGPIIIFLIDSRQVDRVAWLR